MPCGYTERNDRHDFTLYLKVPLFDLRGVFFFTRSTFEKKMKISKVEKRFIIVVFVNYMYANHNEIKQN